MKRSISILAEKIRQYLENFQKYCRSVNNPFVTSVGNVPSQDNLLQKQFIDLVNDGYAGSLFSKQSCNGLWIEMAL